MKLVQCVPNFSEGRDKEKVGAIVKAISGAPGVFVMDVEMDPNHNRSVITFFGPPEGAAEGAYLGAQKALELIDMRTHKGEHPRMGATDVIPFTPVLGVTMTECVELAKRLGQRLARDLSLPIFLYGLAAQKPGRENLANVRKGEYEGLSKEIGQPERHPDFGEPKMHPNGGATAVGAREHIINFNVNLKSSDKALAASIAKAVRTSGGGLPELRAKEIELSDKGQMQISTVLTNYSVTGLNAAWQAIEKRAEAAGVPIVDSELIGLVPGRALIDFALERLKVTGFDPDKQLFDNKLLGLLATEVSKKGSDWTAGAAHFAETLSAPLPVPGGGSAAAAMGAIGIALAEKVCAIHQRKITKAGTNGKEQGGLSKFSELLQGMRNKFIELTREDADSYAAVAQAYKIPKDKGLEREAAIETALQKAALIPLETMHLGMKALQGFMDYKPLVPPAVGSDFKVGFYALAAAVHGAKENVLINLQMLKNDKFRNKHMAELTALDSRLKEFLQELFA